MAKLIRLNRNNEYKYQDREIPLVVDVDLTVRIYIGNFIFYKYYIKSVIVSSYIQLNYIY